MTMTSMQWQLGNTKFSGMTFPFLVIRNSYATFNWHVISAVCKFTRMSVFHVTLKQRLFCVSFASMSSLCQWVNTIPSGCADMEKDISFHIKSLQRLWWNEAFCNPRSKQLYTCTNCTWHWKRSPWVAKISHVSQIWELRTPYRVAVSVFPHHRPVAILCLIPG